MAWRPDRYLVGGELDNTKPRKVTGWMEFVGLESRVTFDLDGDFHRDIRGAKIEFHGSGGIAANARQAAEYFRQFATHQTGKVGDMTAGLPPHDYGRSPYLEWYSDQNGRVVVELDSEQLEVVGTPIPYIESDPISRKEQEDNMKDYLRRAAEALRRERDMRSSGGNGAIRPGNDQPKDP